MLIAKVTLLSNFKQTRKDKKEMQLNKTYSVERLDKYNYIIAKHINYETKKGEKAYRKETLGYYSTFESACINALELQINTQDLKTIISSIKEANSEIIKAIAQARKEVREDLLIK